MATKVDGFLQCASLVWQHINIQGHPGCQGDHNVERGQEPGACQEQKQQGPVSLLCDAVFSIGGR
eukprot:4310998-Alexandrium_andersonii.AAC.1